MKKQGEIIMEDKKSNKLAVMWCGIILVFSILTIFSFILPFASFGGCGCTNGDVDVEVMAFEVWDGVNKDSEQGCFFAIRAVKSVDIDPTKYFFYVAENGLMPKALDFDFRDYQNLGEDELNPVGGDRNKSYRYDDKNWKIEGMKVEQTGSKWSDGEYIGFDMPTASMGIDIVEGKTYEIMIKSPDIEIIYTGTFVYQEREL
jgi:hypothetical protein